MRIIRKKQRERVDEVKKQTKQWWSQWGWFFRAFLYFFSIFVDLRVWGEVEINVGGVCGCCLNIHYSNVRICVDRMKISANIQLSSRLSICNFYHRHWSVRMKCCLCNLFFLFVLTTAEQRGSERATRWDEMMLKSIY